MMHLAREAVGRKPFDQSVRLEKCPVQFFRGGFDYAVKFDGVGFGHRVLLVNGSILEGGDQNKKGKKGARNQVTRLGLG